MRIYIVFVKLPIDDSSESTSFTKNTKKASVIFPTGLQHKPKLHIELGRAHLRVEGEHVNKYYTRTV